MAENIKIEYKIYLEAEDVSQSRILSSTSFVKNLFQNCGNSYFKQVQFDDESDLDEFAFRLYAENTITEDTASNLEDLKNFCGDMAEFLEEIAATQSYLDMEGSFGIEHNGEIQSYTFKSEQNQDFCDFIPVEK
ncbi:MAG: hypothetical protein ACI4HI_02855 [Lachnospiraceae bacterium]